MTYKVHISKINILAYLQRVATLKVLIVNNVRNDNFIVVTESSDHDRVQSMSCLQKVVHKIKYTHEKICENVYVWSDGVRSQFRCRYVFKLLASIALPVKTLSWYYNERHHGKGPMDGIGGTEFAPSIHSILPENENIVEPKDIGKARKIDQTFKIYNLKRKCSQNGDNCISFFFKIVDNEDSFYMHWYGCENEITMLKAVRVIMNERNGQELAMSMKRDHVSLYVVNGNMKIVFMSNLSHHGISLDYIKRLS